ncbi:MAG: (Fe-S)-binding protein [Deltaproteobacteria bacterium]|nr:(Fe-S)-binding protein [bacterium]MCB9476094.1 (Fe-S)-binding protein [Deltaproteobacteria bacterium]MCB9479397.1 (Fe-S)-binding protein [Deltaproteobacteria bacterium]MCB9488645.1 (Fe-S)-binding protein [Deltaproteobacteria bacterium]
MKPVLNQHFKSIEFCTYCPKMCRFACPVAEVTGHEADTPWGRQTLMHLVREGHMDFDADVAAAIYRCATCSLCTEYCDHNNKPYEVMLDMRAEAVKEGIEPSEVEEFRQFYSQHNNSYGDNLQARIKTLLPEIYFAKSSQVIFVPSGSHIVHNPSVIQDTFKIFEAMEIDHVSCHVGEVMDTGAHLRELGLMEQYHANAKKLSEALAGYKTIVSGSPTVVYELKVMYPKFGYELTPKIYHVSEFLWPFVRQGRLKVRRRLTQKAIYHDSCRLGRDLGVYDPPRDILREVLAEPPAEFARNREKSECCGGQGAFPWIDQDASIQIAQRRLGEVYESEKRLLVTACPMCERQFRLADEKLDVVDLVSVVARVV